MDAIGDMLDNQVPARQMVSDIFQKYGITEKPSEDTLKELKEGGATDDAALRSASVHPEAANTRRRQIIKKQLSKR